MNKLKILYIFCSDNFSGAEIVMYRLISANVERINPLAVCPPGVFADRLKGKGIEVNEEVAFSSIERSKNNILKTIGTVLKRQLSITRKITRILNSEDFYAVHANNLAAAFYLLPSIFLSKLKRNGIKWIWSNHDLTYPDGVKSERLATLCHKYYDMTLAVSNAVKLKFRNRNHKIKVLYNGLDVTRFHFKIEERLKFREQYKIKNQSIVIGIVGSISKEKGHRLLMTAFLKLLNDFPDLVLFIIGKNSAIDKRCKMITRELIESFPKSTLILSEPREDIENVYSGLDILVNATSSKKGEPLGTTIYEAMACERIVVASNTGGTAEIIDDMENGVLFNPDDVDDLTEKLLFILRNWPQFNILKVKAREKVLNRFSIEKMTANYNQILESI